MKKLQFLTFKNDDTESKKPFISILKDQVGWRFLVSETEPTKENKHTK